MKILIDAIGAPAHSGGVELWAVQTINQWSTTFPNDELTVVGHSGLGADHGSTNLTFIPVKANGPVRRALLQLFFIPWIFIAKRFERLLVLNPVLSPVLGNANTTVINHDWRHLRRPEEFSWAQRTYRKLWEGSTRRSSQVIAISDKTAGETLRVTGREGVHVISPGADHLSTYTAEEMLGGVLFGMRFFVTFAHHSNKRPELAVASFARLVNRRKDAGFVLVILGARGEVRDGLAHLGVELGVYEMIMFIEYASPPDYAGLIRNSAGVLVLSTDEGYSIPIAEAGFYGVPAIVSERSGVASLVHSVVNSVGDNIDDIAESMARALEAEPRKANIDSAVRTWRDVVTEVRDVVLD